MVKNKMHETGDDQPSDAQKTEVKDENVKIVSARRKRTAIKQLSGFLCKTS